MSEARVSVRGLSKVFRRQASSRVKGIAMDGPAALRHLVAQMMKRSARQEIPARDDKRFFWALDGLDFEVAPGEVLGIIGRNGAGKTTLLKILARVLHLSAGRAIIRGRVASMLELGIGFAPELTVRQNLQAQGHMAGIPAKRIAEAEDEILEFARMTEYRELLLGECPGGSAVQLGFAAMIGFGVEVILADEVLAVGDSAFRHACEERVRAAGASGESVLFVSHDMAAIRRICTRVMWIDRGRIMRTGPTDEVVQAYTDELLAGRLLPPLTRDGLAASCVLLDVRLLDADREPIGALQLTEPGYIDCLVRVARPDVAATVEIELWQGKKHVLTATSQPISARSTSTFRAGIRIPAHFLNEQQYQARFRLMAAVPGDGEPPAVAAEERLEFPAMNPHPNESVWRDWPWGRAGLISPRLSWTVTGAGLAGERRAATQEAGVLQ